MLKQKYGDFSQHSSSSFSYNVSGFQTLQTSSTLDDLLGEHHVGIQTFSRQFVKETPVLKERHRLEMKRLNNQGRGLRKVLAVQWKGAKKNMEEKNKLLSELQQKLIPLEKETADNLLEKEIIEGKLKEEYRRYTDLMARIDKASRQLEAFSACPETLHKNHIDIQHETRNESFGDAIFCSKDAIHADLATDIETENKSPATATVLANQEVDAAASPMGEPEAQEADSLMERKVSEQMVTSAVSKSIETTDHCVPAGATSDSENVRPTTKIEKLCQTKANAVTDEDLKTNCKQPAVDQIPGQYLSHTNSDTEIIETYVVTSDVENIRTNTDTNSAITGSQQVSSPNAEASDNKVNVVFESENMAPDQNQPISEEDLEGVIPSEEQMTPSAAVVMSGNLMSNREKENNEHIMADEGRHRVNDQNPEPDMTDFETVTRANRRNNQLERSNRDTQLPESERKSVNNRLVCRRPEMEQPQPNKNVTLNRNVNINRNVNMNMNVNMNIRVNGNQAINHNMNMSGFHSQRTPLQAARQPTNVQSMPMRLNSLNGNPQQDRFLRVPGGNQQTRFQRGPGGNHQQDRFPRDRQPTPAFQRGPATQQQHEIFQRGPGWYNGYNGVACRFDRR